MKTSLLLSLMLAACARAPEEKPLVDLTTLNVARVRPDAVRFEPTNRFRRLYEGPPSRGAAKGWLAGLRAAREEDRKNIATDRVEGVYEKIPWTQANFVEAPVMVHDRFFYDPSTHRYTVDRFLDDAKVRYGGVDSVLLWQAYPNLGIDERNQFDLLRDLPGGLPALREAVSALHRRGVRALLAYSPWDTGTSTQRFSARAAGISDLVKEVGADGFFGDTMVGPDRDYFVYSDERYRKPLALEPEAGMGESIESIQWTPMSWANWKDYQRIPGVDRYRWVEPRFMTHVEDRNSHSRNDAFQYAWFNGAGVLAWENVFGAWNGFSSSDAENLRRMALIYRALPDFPRSAWEPHSAIVTRVPDVFASRWDLPHSGTVWTFVNRGGEDATGKQLEVEYRAQHFYNLWTGDEILPEEKLINKAIRHATLSFDIPAHGFGAVIEVNEPPTKFSPLYDLLPAMRERERHATRPRPFQYLPQRMVEPNRTIHRARAPEGMVSVPGAAAWKFRVRGTEFETTDGTDVQYPWETHPQIEHEAVRDIAPFYLDRVPVTNRQYKKYLDTEEYTPRDRHNFLRDWPDGKLPAELADKAVTWISIEEARLYCKSLGKRLPHEWEWQYAAQGADERPFPWGRQWDGNRVPHPDLGHTRRPGPDVGSFPEGASPFGALDMVGLVWQFTDEFYDSRTRAAVLKGGSYYQPSGSPWYFPTRAEENENPSTRGQTRVDEHSKYLLMDPSIDRSGTIGFRCAAD